MELFHAVIGRSGRRAAGAQRCASLEAFVEASGRWGDAAESLGVHRHTLRHRIRRIERLTGRDLDRARDRVELAGAQGARACSAAAPAKPDRGPAGCGTDHLAQSTRSRPSACSSRSEASKLRRTPIAARSWSPRSSAAMISSCCSHERPMRSGEPTKKTCS